MVIWLAPFGVAPSTATRRASGSTPRLRSTVTPTPSVNSRPSSMCSGAMYSCPNCIASWRANDIVFLARSVNRSNMGRGA